MKYNSIPAAATLYAVNLDYSCVPTLPIAQNRNIIHNIDTKVAYTQFQDTGLSRFPEKVQ